MSEKVERKLAEFTLEDFSKAEYYCWKADKIFAAADEEYECLKEHGKDLLAVLMTELAEVPGEYVLKKDESVEEVRPPLKKMSETALERLARSGEKWRIHRQGEHAARRKRNELRFKSRAAQRYFDCIQSGLAYKRAELSRLGGQDA